MRIIRGKYGKGASTSHTTSRQDQLPTLRRKHLQCVGKHHRFRGQISTRPLCLSTGAISYEFLSRGCSPVVAVESAQTQVGFIRSVKEKLGDDNLKIVRGDAFRFAASCRESFDIVFADPLQPSAIRRNTGNHPRQPRGKTGNDSRSGAFLEP